MDHMAEQSKNKSSQKSCILYTPQHFFFGAKFHQNMKNTNRMGIFYYIYFPFMGKKNHQSLKKKLGF
jgi:hypothetical protein